MTERGQQATEYDEEIDLRDLFRALWDGKWLIGGVAFVASVIAVIIALMLPNIYRAEALLAPNQDEGGSSLSALAAQYGGLASLAGISFGDAATDKTGLGLEVLKSRRFIADFVERHNILVPLMASEGWDLETDQLQIDENAYDLAAKKWIREMKPPRKAAPSMQEAYEAFSDRLSLSQNSDTGFITVAFEFYSPNIARQWVEWLVQDINEEIMRQDVAKAEESIAYLNKQIESTSLADLQSVFFKLIEEQTKTVMLANVSDEYLFKTIDPPIAPEEKARPKRSLIVLLTAFLGGLLGIVIQLFRSTGASSRP